MAALGQRPLRSVTCVPRQSELLAQTFSRLLSGLRSGGSAAPDSSVPAPELPNSMPSGQTTENKKAPIHYIISINDLVYRPLEKCFQKIPKKFHDKTVQSNILWLNLNKIGAISILQSAHKEGNPSFHFHAPVSKRRYPCPQTASAVTKYFPCFVLIIASDMHLEPESKKRAKNVHFHTTKNIQIQPTLFRYF